MTPDSRLQSTNSSLQTPVYAFVSLGSNMGDRAGNLLLAVRGILDAGLAVVRLSSVYETEPVDVIEQPPFLNMVAEIECRSLASPEQMMARLLRIEYALGRRRNIRRGPRIIDLDLLLYGNELRQSEFLTLPHPRLHQRRFVLIPLAEIQPHFKHPTIHKTFSELLAETQDKAEVRRWQPEKR